MEHRCIKTVCGRIYQSEDPDPNYCPEHLAESKAIAAEIDRKLASRPHLPTKSLIQEYDEAHKVKGFMYVKL